MKPLWTKELWREMALHNRFIPVGFVQTATAKVEPGPTIISIQFTYEWTERWYRERWEK